ncbi:MAG: LytTR family DNA-binding domain-containing protein [Ethanoligenens sp.]
MKVEFKLEPELDDPYAEIHAAELTRTIEEAMRLLVGSPGKAFVGVLDKKSYLLDPKQIICFFCEGQYVYARTAEGRFSVRERIYEIEKQLVSSSFLRISSSAIANVDKIESLEMSLNGTMRIAFKDGTSEYSSRRYVAKIKGFLGL